MKKILLAMAALALASVSAFSAPCAATGTLAAYQGVGSCTVTGTSFGSWTLSNFLVFNQVAQNYGGVPTASSIQMTITQLTNGFSLTYSTAGSPDFFTSNGPMDQDVSWSNGIWITGTNVTQISNTAVVASGNSYESFSKIIQNQMGVPQHASLNIVFDAITGSQTVSTAVGSYGTNLSINDRVVFDSKTITATGVQRSGTITSYTNTFLATPPPSGDVPEPMTFVLMGAGLVGVAVLRRRNS